jgi:hypothetical protein
VVENTEGIKTNVSLMLRFITSDRGRVADIYIDGQKIGDITVQQRVKGADEQGFFNVEYRIPDELLVDSKGKVKQKLTFKIVASPNTMCPGLYYLRLLKDYKDHAYQWNATDWKTGDAGRVAQSNFTYNDDNTITINSGTGTNNLCLSLNYEEVEDDMLKASQKYFVVKANNVRVTSGTAYLWWLNGINRGSSVAPTKIKSLSDGTAFIWDMTQTNLNDNNTGDPFSICQGATIFGLTSKTGTSTVQYIGFVDDISNLEATVGIPSTPALQTTGNGERRSDGPYYDLSGHPVTTPQPNRIYIVNGQQKLKK